MELEFSVKDQQHRLSVVAHEGRTELVFDAICVHRDGVFGVVECELDLFSL
jgi:hypothetical protein